MKGAYVFRRENVYMAVIFAAVYLLALLLADIKLTYPAAALLVCLAIAMYVIRLRFHRSPADPGALLLLFWTAGLALAILRLSSLHTPWTWQTKLCFGAFPVCFLLGDSVYRKKVDKPAKWEFSLDKLFYCILLVSCISAITFTAEAIILGYIPIFSEETHAYSDFHVTGVHYFTVSSMFTHALTAIYIMYLRKHDMHLDRKRVVQLLITNLVSLSIAVMCISKLQFFLIVGLPALIVLGSVRIKDFRSLPWKRIIIIGAGLVAGLVAVVVAFTALRHYEPGYLNEIFEFRNENTPIWIQYPYMYIANNYANFNCLTEELTEYTYGLRQLFPLFALTGTKFIWPELVNFPLYVVKEEINTLTIIYDAYYDFGIIGVMGFGLILGYVSRFVSERCTSNKNPVFMLFYGQIGIYMVLSFFSAWYSVATTWFWFVISGILCLVTMKRVGGGKNEVPANEQ